MKVQLLETEEKLEFLINPNAAYVLTVVAVMLFLLAALEPRSKMPMIAMALCLIVAGYELVYLKGNPWMLLVVALSPLPFLIAIRQTRPAIPLLIISILMLTVGAAFFLTDQNGHPAVNYGLAGFISVICGDILWIALGRKQNAQGRRLNNDPDSVVGLIGEVRTDIPDHSTGSILVEGELWQARSEKPIAAGGTVRILRRDGFVLTVKKEEQLIKE
jgi:membrane-bound serine protease (ClpP class)